MVVNWSNMVITEIKKGKTQIVFGLLCSAKGCPIAVEVFEGNTSDGATLAGQIEKVINGLGD
jgi:transposase